MSSAIFWLSIVIVVVGLTSLGVRNWRSGGRLLFCRDTVSEKVYGANGEGVGVEALPISRSRIRARVFRQPGGEYQLTFDFVDVDPLLLPQGSTLIFSSLTSFLCDVQLDVIQPGSSVMINLKEKVREEARYRGLAFVVGLDRKQPT
jgi:hypothetical protein